MTRMNIVFDLHGVLVNTEVLAKEYTHNLAVILHEEYGVPLEKAKSNYLKAFAYWIQEFRSWKAVMGKELKAKNDDALRKWTSILFEKTGTGPCDLLAYGEYLEYQVALRIHALYPETLVVLRALRKRYPDTCMFVASSAHTR
ncbi:MAG: hypothetical protein ACTSVM_03300, partial [Candidatus Ranarchaeia archaeon]